MVGEVDGEVVGSVVVGEVDGDKVGSEVVGELDGDKVGSELVGDTDGDMVGSEVVGEVDGEVVPFADDAARTTSNTATTAFIAGSVGELDGWIGDGGGARAGVRIRRPSAAVHCLFNCTVRGP